MEMKSVGQVAYETWKDYQLNPANNVRTTEYAVLNWDDLTDPEMAMWEAVGEELRHIGYEEGHHVGYNEGFSKARASE